MTKTTRDDALNHDKAPEHTLRELAAEIDCLITHNCTRAELRDAEALYKGAKQAGGDKLEAFANRMGRRAHMEGRKGKSWR